MSVLNRESGDRSRGFLRWIIDLYLSSPFNEQDSSVTEDIELHRFLQILIQNRYVKIGLVRGLGCIASHDG